MMALGGRCFVMSWSFIVTRCDDVELFVPPGGVFYMVPLSWMCGGDILDT